MLKAYKYRLDPDKQQTEYLNKHVGCCRRVYNDALAMMKEAYEEEKIKMSARDASKKLVEWKQEHTWLKEVSASSLDTTISQNLGNAWKNFYRRIKEGKKGKEVGYPKFKKKSYGGSVPFRKAVKLHIGESQRKSKIKFPKLEKEIKVILHRIPKGEFRQATVTKTPTGKFYISMLYKTKEVCPDKPAIAIDKTVGVDVGLTKFYVLSNGETYKSQRYLRRLEGRLKYQQRQFSKQYKKIKESKWYKKIEKKKGKIIARSYLKKRLKKRRLRIAKLHEKVSKQRSYFLHTISTEIVKNHDSIAAESLKIKNMVKCKSRAKSIHDAGWGMFFTMLQYKSDWQGKNLMKIDTYAPSSKACSQCGWIDENQTEKDRIFCCKSCGLEKDRDENAAINIRDFAVYGFKIEKRAGARYVKSREVA